jgi:archaeosine-15-forming tRNA-guanine transglycosylase
VLVLPEKGKIAEKSEVEVSKPDGTATGRLVESFVHLAELEEGRKVQVGANH